MSEAISEVRATAGEEAAAADRTDFTAGELLANAAVSEPLIANGVRCHGGFDTEGRYHSPRTLHRTPAIEAWQAALRRSGHPLVEVDSALIPPQYPSDAQSLLLLRHGIREPVIRAVTVISIVEGFGAIIRDLRVPDLEALVVEPIEGTCLAHLDKGLFEAHARDEAGYRDEGGHKQMWEAARDLAFESPKIPGDVLMRMMGRRSRAPKRARAFPQLDAELERLVQMMSQVLVIEIFAERVFEWGKTVMGNASVSADPAGAAAMVSHIQNDENPHVEYLRTALSELCARTLRTADGGTLPGKWLVHGFMHGVLAQITQSRPEEQRDDTAASLEGIFREQPVGSSLREEFEGLAKEWMPPSRTGFELAPDGSALESTGSVGELSE